MSSTPPIRKALKVQPKITARRSKAERDALEKAENERKRLRAEAAAADAAAEALSKRAEYGLASAFRGGREGGRGGRTARGGRGGFMGSRIVTRPQLPQPLHAFMTGSGSQRSGGGSSHQRPSVKRESDIKREADGDIAMLGIKRDPDDYGYISSDDDEAALGPRVNVDQINLVSEDEENDNPSDTSDRRNGTSRSMSGRRRAGPFLPIRINRKEHRDRVVGMNTEASSATATVLRKKAEEKSHVEEGTTTEAVPISVTRKASIKPAHKATAKTKSKHDDVEIVGKWRGVYDDDSSDVPIKQEPVEDSDTLIESLPNPATIEQLDDTNDEENGQFAEPQADPESKAGLKARTKQRKKFESRPAQYQTVEEIREWDKHQENLATMQQELGRININSVLTENNEPGGSSQMQETEQADKKQDAIYLFQFPPIMPDLAEPIVKQEAESPDAERSKKPTAHDLPIKLEEDEFGGDPLASRSRRLTVAPGWAGKLRVYKSGRTTMTWGGTDMEIKMGINPFFLQTAILTRMGENAGKPYANSAGNNTNEFGGEVIAFGQIRGKLVVTPNWTDILS